MPNNNYSSDTRHIVHNSAFDATYTYKLATIGVDGTVKQAGFVNITNPELELKAPEFINESQFFLSLSCIHVYKITQTITPANLNNSQFAFDHNFIIDDDITITVQTADTTKTLTYYPEQWQEDGNGKKVLPLTVIDGALHEPDAILRSSGGSDAIKAAKSKSITLTWNSPRNDFVVNIEYSGVVDDNDTPEESWVPLYDLYGIERPEAESKIYNTIVLADENVGSPEVLAVRYIGLNINLDDDHTEEFPSTDFVAFIKVHAFTELESTIDFEIVSTNYNEHIKKALIALSGGNEGGEHSHIFDSDNHRAYSDAYDGWGDVNPSKVVENDDGDPTYSTETPQLYVDNNAISQRYAGSGYNYDAHIWFYWDRDQVAAVLNTSNKEPLVLKYIGFNSRTGAFMYNFFEVQTTNNEKKYYIAVAGSNYYHYVDLYRIDDSLYNQLHHTDLTATEPIYRTNIFRWYDALYVQTENGIVCIKPEELGLLTDVWQDITQNGYTNYLYHQIRLHEHCGITNLTEQNDNVYLTEFSDLGDVGIQYNKNGELYYVGLCPKDIDVVSSVTYDLQHASQEISAVQIDSTDAFKNALNYFDMDYTDKQNTLEMMYRQSAYHIKHFVDHNYKIIYLGPRYSVGYDRENEMYLFLMKDMIHGEFRRTRQKKSDFETKYTELAIIDLRSGSYKVSSKDVIDNATNLVVKADLVDSEKPTRSVCGEHIEDNLAWSNYGSFRRMNLYTGTSGKTYYLQYHNVGHNQYSKLCTESISTDEIPQYPMVVYQSVILGHINEFADDFVVDIDGNVADITNLSSRTRIFSRQYLASFIASKRGIFVHQMEDTNNVVGYDRILNIADITGDGNKIFAADVSKYVFTISNSTYVLSDREHQDTAAQIPLNSYSRIIKLQIGQQIFTENLNWTWDSGINSRVIIVELDNGICVRLSNSLSDDYAEFSELTYLDDTAPVSADIFPIEIWEQPN